MVENINNPEAKLEEAQVRKKKTKKETKIMPVEQPASQEDIQDAVFKGLRACGINFGEPGMDLAEFNLLPPEKQFLAVQNLRQWVLAYAEDEAGKKHQAGLKKHEKGSGALDSGKTFLQNVWHNLFKEKKILGLENARIKDIKQGIHAPDIRQALAEVTRGADQGPDVKIFQGQKGLSAQTQYSSLFLKKFGIDKTRAETLEAPVKAALGKYNQAASLYGNLPAEWGGRTSEVVSKSRKFELRQSEFNRYEKIGKEYEAAKNELINIFGGEIKNFGDETEQRKAMANLFSVALEVDTQVKMDQCLKAAPDLENQILKIKNSSSLLKYSLNKLKSEKGLAFAGGLAARNVARIGLSALGAEVAGSGAVLAAGAATPLALFGLAAGYGYWRGKIRGKNELREKDRTARKEKIADSAAIHQFRHELLDLIKADPEKKNPEIQSRIIELRSMLNVGSGKEQRNWVSSESLAYKFSYSIGRLDRQSDQLAKEPDLKKKQKEIEKFNDLLNSLAERVNYTRRKIEEGLVNFGDSRQTPGNLYRLNEKISEALVKVEFYENNPANVLESGGQRFFVYGRSYFDKKTGEQVHENPQERLDRMLDLKNEKISENQKKFIARQARKGMMFGMVFYELGFAIREFAEAKGWVEGPKPESENAPISGENILDRAKVKEAKIKFFRQLPEDTKKVFSKNISRDDFYHMSGPQLRQAAIEAQNSALSVSCNLLLSQEEIGLVKMLKAELPEELKPRAGNIFSVMGKGTYEKHVRGFIAFSRFVDKNLPSQTFSPEEYLKMAHYFPDHKDIYVLNKALSLSDEKPELIKKVIDNLKNYGYNDDTNIPYELGSFANIPNEPLSQEATGEREYSAANQRTEPEKQKSPSRPVEKEKQPEARPRRMAPVEEKVAPKESAAPIPEDIIKVPARGLKTDFNLTLGQGKVPAQLERVLHMMAVDHMNDALGSDGLFGEEEGAKSLNMAANLVKILTGKKAAGISPEELKGIISWDEKTSELKILDHDKFNAIEERLENHADKLWKEGRLEKGAVKYLDDIKTKTWEKIIQAQGLEEKVAGHDEVTAEKIEIFKARENPGETIGNQSSAKARLSGLPDKNTALKSTASPEEPVNPGAGENNPKKAPAGSAEVVKPEESEELRNPRDIEEIVNNTHFFQGNGSAIAEFDNQYGLKLKMIDTDQDGAADMMQVLDNDDQIVEMYEKPPVADPEKGLGDFARKVKYEIEKSIQTKETEFDSRVGHTGITAGKAYKAGINIWDGFTEAEKTKVEFWVKNSVALSPDQPERAKEFFSLAEKAGVSYQEPDALRVFSKMPGDILAKEEKAAAFMKAFAGDIGNGGAARGFADLLGLESFPGKIVRTPGQLLVNYKGASISMNYDSFSISDSTGQPVKDGDLGEMLGRDDSRYKLNLNSIKALGSRVDHEEVGVMIGKEGVANPEDNDAMLKKMHAQDMSKESAAEATGWQETAQEEPKVDNPQTPEPGPGGNEIKKAAPGEMPARESESGLRGPVKGVMEKLAGQATTETGQEADKFLGQLTNEELQAFKSIFIDPNSPDEQVNQLLKAIKNGDLTREKFTDYCVFRLKRYEAGAEVMNNVKESLKTCFAWLEQPDKAEEAKKYLKTLFVEAR